MFSFSDTPGEANDDAVTKKQKVLERLQKRRVNVPSQQTSLTTKPDPDAQAAELLSRAASVLESSDKAKAQELAQELLEFINDNPKSRLLPTLRGKREELNRVGIKTAFKFGAAKKASTSEQAKARETSKSEEVTQQPSSGAEYASPNMLPKALRICDQTGQRMRVVPSDASNTVIVERVTGCTLTFPFESTSVQLTDIRDSTLIFLPVHSSFLLRNCHNTTLVASAQQIRIHDANDLTLYTSVRGSVIIENCRNVRVGPYRVESSSESNASQSLLQSTLPPISDFDAPTGISPNWTSIPESQWQTFSLDV
ncbi:Protein Y71H2AM.24 [Aphelenchoides avenae]|nr:Protein Y71H2AM.24 [Aphelenchus avenae]